MTEIKVGDTARVVKDRRAKGDGPFATFFRSKIGQTGKVSYVDMELVSIKFHDGAVAYWHSEVEKVEDPTPEAGA